MNINSFSKFLQRLAILLAITVTMGAGYIVSAQAGDPVPNKFVKMDLNGDGRIDVAFQSPGTSKWLIQSMDGAESTFSVGAPDALAVIGDYDGDHIEDLASVTYKGGSMVWQILRSTDNVEINVTWGLVKDVPVQADYDGDGMIDPAVYRRSEGVWYILASSTGEMIARPWGAEDDIVMPGDYDGDGLSDVCVYRAGTNTFYYLGTRDDQMYEQVFGPFAVTGYETFVPADYDGDGKTDFAIYDASVGGTWTILESASGKYRVVSFAGSSPICSVLAYEPCMVSDFAIPGDYDYDGKIDQAIWDSKNAIVKVRLSKGVMEFPMQTTENMIAVTSFYTTKK